MGCCPIYSPTASGKGDKGGNSTLKEGSGGEKGTSAAATPRRESEIKGKNKVTIILKKKGSQGAEGGETRDV